jgi:uncharacterized protein YpmB
MQLEILTPSNIVFILGIIGTIFTIYSYFKNPQIKTEKDAISLTDKVATLEKTVTEIREKHLATVETDLRNLNTTLQKLSETVVRLSTIIDERIPKANLK